MDVTDRSDSFQRRGAESTYQCETGEAASEAVVNLVAALHDDDPTTMQPPLYEAVDPDALDALFVDAAGRWTRPSGRVEFSFCGYLVEVRGDGRITVQDDSAGYGD